MPVSQKTSHDDLVAHADAVILCGGLGKRLGTEIGDKPKGLAPIRGKPILDIIVDYLLEQGTRRIVLAVGHMKDQISAHFSGRQEAEFAFSVENSPLGTGGAVLHALDLVRSDPFFVVNGDSYCPAPLDEVCRKHLEARASATIVVTKPAGRDDAGNVVLDDTGWVAEFAEKRGEMARGRTFMNAGIYLMQKDVFENAGSKQPFSLEYEVFPKLAASHRCIGVVVDSEVVDIGTPARLRAAQDLLP